MKCGHCHISMSFSVIPLYMICNCYCLYYLLRILVQHVPQFKVVLKPNNIPSKFTKEVSTKSEVVSYYLSLSCLIISLIMQVPLGVQLWNENKLDEMA